jgi:hypothetical protein
MYCLASRFKLSTGLLRLWTLERKEGMEKCKPPLTATTINIPKAHSAPLHTPKLIDDPKKWGKFVLVSYAALWSLPQDQDDDDTDDSYENEQTSNCRNKV